MQEADKLYFTLEEANSQIPMLERTFARLLQLNAHLKSTYKEVDEAGFAPNDDDFEIAPPGATTDVVHKLATLRTLFDATHDTIDDLVDAGCVVKHIEDGLVDWYAMKDDREVFLCWKLGEKSIRYWHEVDTDYAGRQPIDTF